jgi:isoaspartyl peptidase/L-asparaginase-like protein (Ntn-hydrolase superfamily)
MDGTTHRAGPVLNLHEIKNPISVARLVMEKTRHTQIAGEGALRFAMEMGFEPMQLLTPAALGRLLDQRLGVEDSPARGLVPYRAALPLAPSTSARR